MLDNMGSNVTSYTYGRHNGNCSQHAMDSPAPNHGVSMKDIFNPNAANYGELNPTDFATSTSPSL